jgi:hypothetical protein
MAFCILGSVQMDIYPVNSYDKNLTRLLHLKA